MLRQLIIFNILLLFFATSSTGSTLIKDKTDRKPITITANTLTADNKNHTATFEGSVVAKTGDISMYSDRMIVYYDDSNKKIHKIVALGNVRVVKENRALFSDKAVYLDKDQKIIFSGNPRVVENNNVISGEEIIFYLKDDRAVVEGSRVTLHNEATIQ